YAPGELPTVIDALAAVPASDRVPDLLAFTETFDERILVAASRSSEREGIPGCDSDARPVGGNGQLSADGLCTIPWAERYKLRADAATSLAAMNTAYRARFDRDLCLASAYRTYSEQVRLKAIKGGLAAPAGKSNHGWGLAVDFCRTTVSGESWDWLEANGPTFGWVNPNWARRGGTGPYEPWNCEVEEAVMADGGFYGWPPRAPGCRSLPARAARRVVRVRPGACRLVARRRPCLRVSAQYEAPAHRVLGA